MVKLRKYQSAWIEFNPFVPNAPFLFSADRERCIENEWVNACEKKSTVFETFYQIDLNWRLIKTWVKQ